MADDKLPPTTERAGVPGAPRDRAPASEDHHSAIATAREILAYRDGWDSRIVILARAFLRECGLSEHA